MSARITGLFAFLLTLSAVVGGVVTVEARYASTDQLEQVSDRLNQKILQDRLAGLQERLWSLEDRWSDRFYGTHQRYPATFDELLAWVPDEAREQFRDLLREIREIEALLDAKDR